MFRRLVAFGSDGRMTAEYGVCVANSIEMVVLLRLIGSLAIKRAETNLQGTATYQQITTKIGGIGINRDDSKHFYSFLSSLNLIK